MRRMAISMMQAQTNTMIWYQLFETSGTADTLRLVAFAWWDLMESVVFTWVVSAACTFAFVCRFRMIEAVGLPILSRISNRQMSHMSSARSWLVVCSNFMLRSWTLSVVTSLVVWQDISCNDIATYRTNQVLEGKLLMEGQVIGIFDTF